MSFPVWGTSPLLYAVVLLVLLAAFWGWLPGAVRYPAVAVEVLLLFLTTPLGAHALTRLVLTRLPPPHACAGPLPDTIVVLSAGSGRPPHGADDYGALRILSLRRLFTAVELWRDQPDTRLVISGGGHRRIPDAVPMASLARKLGVPANSIEIERRSRTTWDNARYVAALAPPVPKRIWLVTSAMHMPRALGAFSAWGFEPCAWPSGLEYTRLHFGPDSFVPKDSALTDSTLALHELLGDVEYAVLEWRHARRVRTAADQTP
jgi:uncharacterized SAM-binding protein YcdF (DUF218 family)